MSNKKRGPTFAPVTWGPDGRVQQHGPVAPATYEPADLVERDNSKLHELRAELADGWSKPDDRWPMPQEVRSRIELEVRQLEAEMQWYASTVARLFELAGGRTASRKSVV